MSGEGGDDLRARARLLGLVIPGPTLLDQVVETFRAIAGGHAMRPSIATGPDEILVMEPTFLAMPPPRPRPVDWIIGSRFGGVVEPVAARDRIITIDEPPSWESAMMRDGWRLRRATAWSGVHVVECETMMTVGAHPFVRVRVSEAHPDPGGLGGWRCDDDGGTASEATHVRVERVQYTGSVIRAWLGPVEPVRIEDEWLRPDGGRLAGARVRSGRYVDRLPTNRKRKRERCKARRRERLRLGVDVHGERGA